MSMKYLRLTPHDSLIARDGRPFGVNQGQRMRGLPWLLPSVVAGSFRTALVKANTGLDFSGDMPQKLLAVDAAGVFPVHNNELYLPAPNDAVAEPHASSKSIKTVHRVVPQPNSGGCDFPDDLPLQPVMLPDGIEDFKPADIPAWWPLTKYGEWLTTKPDQDQFASDWFTGDFLGAAQQELRDHVRLDADSGAAAESMLFATAGLKLTHLPRFGTKLDDKKLPFDVRYAEISLSARVTTANAEFAHVDQLDIWHPLGGERRLVHWHHNGNPKLWECPPNVKTALSDASRVRMVLATPAIFKNGWKPGWLTNDLQGEIHGVKLKLVGVTNGRWKAVSGWSLAPPRGPKPVRRMVPAGSVYFFECERGTAAPLADRWLQSFSDSEEDQQDQRDGFGLAVWGTW